MESSAHELPPLTLSGKTLISGLSSMPRKLLLLLTVLGASFFPGMNASARESLYNPGTATKPTTGQQAMLGPKASRYRYDARMLNAAKIAQERARRSSTYSCWRYVKTALLASKAIGSYPQTVYAKQAGGELQKSYGFKKITVKDPYKAPVGSVLVYGGGGPGHVEIRTASGFVSDFFSMKPSPRPLLGVYVKPKA